MQRIVLGLIGVFISLGLSSHAQHDFSIIDRWAHNYQPTTGDIGEIAQTLSENARDDVEKVRAIFQFVIHHIEYDHAATEKGIRRINRTNRDILSRRKAICWGYAQLMTEMCQHIGIPAYTVSGYCHTLPDPSSNFSKPGHAWNAIGIDGEFFLIDATWASNRPTQAEEYFLVPPAQFIKTHYPILPMWQLLDCPVSFGSFVDERTTDALQVDTVCMYAFVDSIRIYAQMNYLDRRLQEERIAYLDNPTLANRSSYGHALIDKAVRLKDQADSLWERGLTDPSILIFQEALSLFEKASSLTDFFTWQKETLGFTYFNYAQALRRKHQVSRPDMMREALLAADSVLSSIEAPSFTTTVAIQQIHQQMRLLK